MKRGRRSGAILIYVLVCMGIGLSLMLAALQSSLRQRRQLQQLVRVEQTDWLVEAGYARAIRQLNQSVDYSGETWQPTAVLAADDPASVEIVIRRPDPAEELSGMLTIEVTAQCGQPQLGERDRLRRQHTFTVADTF